MGQELKPNCNSVRARERRTDLGGSAGTANLNDRFYQAKWANALLASAMRCTFSRRVMEAPSRL